MTTLHNERTAWSDADVERLAQLYFSVPKPSVDVMAATLDRSSKAISTELSRRGMSKPGAKLRTCLGAVCRGKRQFFSIGIGNRICIRCEQHAVMRCA